ncbi:MAG TPA: hypothetical protein VF861_10555 [Telluria sp.]
MFIMQKLYNVDMQSDQRSAFEIAHVTVAQLQDSGIKLSRAWVTKLMPAAVSLIEPISDAQLEPAPCSRVTAVDKTSIKAGRRAPVK